MDLHTKMHLLCILRETLADHVRQRTQMLCFALGVAFSVALVFALTGRIDTLIPASIMVVFDLGMALYTHTKIRRVQGRISRVLNNTLTE